MEQLLLMFCTLKKKSHSFNYSTWKKETLSPSQKIININKGDNIKK